jgi:hypothetical protein
LVVGLVAVKLGRFAAMGPRRDLIAGIAITRGLRAQESLVLAADTATDNGIPARLTNTWIFDPDLLRSTGLGPVMGPPFCPDGGSVQDHTRPVDHALAAQLVQHRAMQPTPQTGFGPVGEPAMCRATRDGERSDQNFDVLLVTTFGGSAAARSEPTVVAGSGARPVTRALHHDPTAYSAFGPGATAFERNRVRVDDWIGLFG